MGRRRDPTGEGSPDAASPPDQLSGRDRDRLIRAADKTHVRRRRKTRSVARIGSPGPQRRRPWPAGGYARWPRPPGTHPWLPLWELLVSELAINAVRHANGKRFSVEFDTDGLLLVAVCDSTTPCRPRDARQIAKWEDGDSPLSTPCRTGGEPRYTWGASLCGSSSKTALSAESDAQQLSGVHSGPAAVRSGSDQLYRNADTDGPPDLIELNKAAAPVRGPDRSSCRPPTTSYWVHDVWLEPYWYPPPREAAVLTGIPEGSQ